jgi:hypothetical protein
VRCTEYERMNSVAYSPQANYADWSTVTGRRILVPTFEDSRVSRDWRGGSPTIINQFCGLEPLLFLLSSSSFMLTRLSRSGNRTRDLCQRPGTLTTRLQMWSMYWVYISLMRPRGSIVVKTLLQAGRSRVRGPMLWMFSINLPNPSGCTRPWGLLSF